MIKITGKTHLSFGILVGTAVVIYTPLGLTSIIGVALGSLLPDIDSEKSIINLKGYNIAGRIWCLIKKWTKKIEPIHNIFKHRGITHSFVPLGICIILFLLYGYQIFLSVAIGMLSHHILDLFSPVKLRYFYPLEYKIGFFKFNSTFEKIFQILFYILIIVIFIKRFV